MEVNLYIKSDELYEPITYSGIEWSTQRMGEPGKLVFTCIKDLNISFSEGSHVRLSVNGKDIFYGFVFEKSRDKNHHIQVTCYDQLRYLKNKETYVYTNKTVDELISMIAGDFNLQVGELESTGFRIAKRVEDNQTLFDIIYNALDLTLIATGKLFVLYDDFGKITLQNIESMKLDTIIDETSAENFDYTSSIDGDTFNKIKLYYDNKDTGKREIYTTQDTSHINQWGVLQYYQKINDGSNGQALADNLIHSKKGKNRKTRTLSINGVKGDLNVRAGVSLPIFLNLGDTQVNNYLIVDQCTHRFDNGYHTMNIKLIGGVGFI